MADYNFKFSQATEVHFILTPSLGVIPYEYRHKWYTAKIRLFGLHFTRKICWCISSTTFA